VVTNPLGSILVHSQEQTHYTMVELTRPWCSVFVPVSKEFFLISEWGWDANSTHSEYKQRSLEDVSDSDIIITSLVPLHLYSSKLAKKNVFFCKMLGILR
jgi:hypothetical protein